MGSKPLISVVMPVYNGKEYICEAIESILNQSLKDFELILIDDGSFDGSLDILKKYELLDSRVKLVSRANKGLASTLNEGILLSNGKFIARMDQDDVSHPMRFEKQIELMNLLSADICGCNWLVINKIGKLIDVKLVPLDKSSFVAYLSHSVPFAHGSVMIKKSFLTQTKLNYNETIFAEDYDFWVRLWNAGAVFCNVSDFLFSYRDTNNSLSKKTSKGNRAETKRIAFKFVQKNIDECIKVSRDFLSRYDLLTCTERVNLILMSFLISKKTKRLNFLWVCRHSNVKSLAFAFLHLLKRF
ncbi:glycosyltransferase [Methylophilaceae bacterium]|nr:glycosyltransferase [Methylophilaceae bacterium]